MLVVFKHKLYIIGFLAFMLPSVLTAQEELLRFHYLSSDNGLSHNLVDCMLKDSKGFMWFGTWNGLNRYDGYTFTVFKPESGNPNSLSGNFIYALSEDDYGNIWAGTENGLNVFISRNGTFIRYSSDVKDSDSISSDRIQALLADAYGYLWVGTDSGLDRLKITTDGIIEQCYHFEVADTPDGLTSGSVNAIFQDNDKNIWIGTSAGLNMIDASSGSVTKYRSNPNVAGSISSDVINTIYQDRRGTIWVGTLYGLNRMEKTSGRFSTFFHDSSDPSSLVHNTVMSIIEDPSGSLIAGTLGGISIFNDKTHDFRNIVSSGTPYFSLNNEFVNCLMYTDDGNIWIGTERGGVNWFNFYQNRFEFFENKLNDPNSLSHNTINSIYEDDRNIWIGTAGGGLNQYVKSSGRFIHHKYSPNSTRGLASDFVSSVYRDSHKELWVGTWGGGLHLLPEGKNDIRELIRYQNDPSDAGSITSNFVSCITEDKTGNIWIGSLGGIDKYNAESQDFEHFTVLVDNKPIDRVGCLYFDQNNNLWAGTMVGLYRIWANNSDKIDCRQSRVDYLTNDPSDSGSVSGNYIISICGDKAGNIWFGTYGNGLNYLSKDLTDKEQLSFISYVEEDGLCNNIIFGILEDRSRRLWMSTDNGLSCLDPETKKFRNYYIADGLLSNQFYWSASYKNDDGKMYFGSMKGLNAFYPDSLIDHMQNQKAIVTDFKIFNSSVIVGEKYFKRIVLEKSIMETDHLIFSFKVKEFSFDFTSLNYIQPERTLYAYKMKGFDDNWTYVDSKRRFVSYTNLRGGDYTFMLMSSQNGNWDNADPVELQITIIPPVWEKNWFRLLLAALVLAGVLLYIRYRTYSLKKQKQKLEKLVNERTAKIEEQKIELQHQAANLKESFLQLEKRRELIEGQKQQLELQNTQILDQRDKLIDLNKKVQQVNSQQLNFFTYISHEFRSPLTLIITPLEQMLSDKKFDALIGEKLRLVIRNAQRLLHLVDQLMEVRKVETGKIDLKAAMGDLVNFTQTISQSFVGLAQQREIDFKVKASDSFINLWFDRDILENIIYNLLSNAFKYTPQGGAVKLEIDKVGADDLPHDEVTVIDRQYSKHLAITGYIMIRVSDSGPGIPTDRIRDIFRRFYRLPSSHPVQGVGIGLYLTKEMVKAHKGLMYVKSVPGKGSSFSVFIPQNREYLNPEDIISDDKTDKSDEENIARTPVTDLIRYPDLLHHDGTSFKRSNLPVILLVDDDSELITYLKGNLNKSFQIITAGDGKEGIEKAGRYSPDLIISDVMMPEMDGLEFCSLVKNDIHTSHIPVILLTARTEVDNYIEGLETGADDYIAKPFNISLLEAKIRGLIENRVKLRKLYMQNLVPVPRELTTTRPDEIFFRKTISVIEQHLSDPGFSVQKLALEMGVSRSLLHKKLIAITDVSANDFITSLRLKKSALLLMEGKMNISEIAFSVGFNDPKYFSRRFKQQFGKPPTEFSAS